MFTSLHTTPHPAKSMAQVGRFILETPQSRPSAFVLEYGLHHILR